MRLKLILKARGKYKKYKDEYGCFENGEIKILLFNFPRDTRKFLKIFVKTLNHEFIHYFISKHCKNIDLKVEEKVCELME